jgi:hypothetical protein
MHSSASLADTSPSSHPLTKAPSYRSEASDSYRPNYDAAPPLPPPTTDYHRGGGGDDYFGHSHGRQPTQEELSYEPLRRTQLYERAVAAQQPVLDRPASQLSYYGHASHGAGGGRPESEYDMGQYYATTTDVDRDPRGYGETRYRR